MGENEYSKQNERFRRLTGMTIEEKNFHNMIYFYKDELIRVLKAEDQEAAIMAIPRRARKILVRYGIIKYGEISAKAREILEMLNKNEEAIGSNREKEQRA